jgi:hypothetical protein
VGKNMKKKREERKGVNVERGRKGKKGERKRDNGK